MGTNISAPIVPDLSSIAPLTGAPDMAPGGSSGSLSGSGFQGVFNEALQQVQQFQSNASASIGRFVSGEGEELHQVALTAQQADLAFDLFLQVRNKVISAYQEVMRMQV